MYIVLQLSKFFPPTDILGFTEIRVYIDLSIIYVWHTFGLHIARKRIELICYRTLGSK